PVAQCPLGAVDQRRPVDRCGLVLGHDHPALRDDSPRAISTTPRPDGFREESYVPARRCGQKLNQISVTELVRGLVEAAFLGWLGLAGGLLLGLAAGGSGPADRREQAWERRMRGAH